VTTITECHLIQRVIPLTLIGKTDDRLAIRAPIASCDNASRNDRAHAPSRHPHDRNQIGRRHSCSWKAEKNRALYLAHKGKPISGQDDKLWEDAIVEDLAEFRKAGLTHPMMSEVERS
jgi:hypothetical protein